jgi:iron complex transport system ATP-binding protein
MSDPALRAEAVTLQIDDAVLVDAVDFEVQPGELVGVVGPNGAGKTSLLRLMSGEATATSGRVLINGTPVPALRPIDLARTRAVLPQHSLLQFAFRALDVVLMGRYPVRHSSPGDDLEAAADAMDETDTGHLADRRYPTLSGGEQTRVALARVLAQETPIVMLDEPTGSLDIRHQEMVMGTLRSLADEGAAVLAVLHDLNLAARYADRVGLMSRGRMREVAPTAEVLRPDLLTEVYGYPVTVVPHPLLHCPLVLPLTTNGAPARAADVSPGTEQIASSPDVG